MTKQSANIFSPVKHRYALALREICAARPRILDVGGYISRNEIVREHFVFPDYKSLNIGPAWYSFGQSDFLYDGMRFPFDDNSFDYVISVDTLEHIVKSWRSSHIDEMIRVARKRVVIVVPFCQEGSSTDESYILSLCNQHGIEAPPSLVEHELYGLPLLNDIEDFAKKHFGKIKYATNRKDYWCIQACMLWNTIALQGNSEAVNRKLQILQEKLLRCQVDPLAANEAYRSVLIFDKT